MSVVQTLIGNVKGPQGATGATDATGPQGDAATINVGSVSTTAYGNPAQVVNVGTESEAVLNFVIPQGKPGQATTTMGGLTLDTITTSTADFPSPQVGDTGATAFGKIVKFFADALSALNSKLNAANVVNNLTTTEAGYALDARAGKTLNDSLDALGVVTSTNIINATYGNIYFWKVGRIVYYWYGSGSITVASGDHQIGTIPESFRPISTVLFPVWPNNASNQGYTAVNANGNVYVRTISAMNYLQGSGCYISAS